MGVMHNMLKIVLVFGIVTIFECCNKESLRPSCHELVGGDNFLEIKACLYGYWEIVYKENPNLERVKHLNSFVNLREEDNTITYTNNGNLIAHGELKWTQIEDTSTIEFTDWKNQPYFWNIYDFQSDTLFLKEMQTGFKYALLKRVFIPTKNCQGLILNKPPDFLWDCIEGNWIINFVEGGISGDRVVSENSFVFFKSIDSIYVTNQGDFFVRDRITWQQISNSPDTFNYLMHFKWNGIDWSWGAVSFKQDTLITFDTGITDGFHYYLTRVE